MYLHPQKTKVMIFGSKRKLNNQSMSIAFKDTTLENVDKITYISMGYIRLSTKLVKPYFSYIQ